MKIRSLVRVAASALLVPVLISSSAAAHVVVKPAEAVTAGYTTFTVGVPVEKDIPTTSVRLVMPEGLEHVTPTVKAGWQADIAKHGEGEDAHVESITWSGNAIAPGFRDEFTFSAKVPAKTTELQWKAYQTYEDGTVVAWDKPANDNDEEGADSGPFSVTKVVAETEQATALKQTEQVAEEAAAHARRSQTVAATAFVVAIVAVYFASRKR